MSYDAIKQVYSDMTPHQLEQVEITGNKICNEAILEMFKCLKTIMECKELHVTTRVQVSYCALSDLIEHYKNVLNFLGMEISYAGLLCQLFDTHKLTKTLQKTTKQKETT